MSGMCGAGMFSGFMVKALPDESVLRNFDSMDGALATHLPIAINTVLLGLLARLTKQVRKPSRCGFVGADPAGVRIHATDRLLFVHF